MHLEEEEDDDDDEKEEEGQCVTYECYKTRPFILFLIFVLFYLFINFFFRCIKNKTTPTYKKNWGQFLNLIIKYK